MKALWASLWKPGPDPENKHVGTWREWIPFWVALIGVYVTFLGARGQL